MIYMLSYPRCGSSFVRYCVENLLQKPTLDCGGRLNKVYGNSVQYKSNIPILRKEHFIKGINTKVEKLILLVRNYKDSFISHNLRTFDLEKEVDIMYDNLIKADYFYKEYYDLIDYYDKFDQEKLIVYYEELIKKPQISIENILNFLDDEYELPPKEIEKLKQESQQKYCTKHGFTRTNKIKNLYEIFSKEQNYKLDQIFQDYNKQLYDEYLTHYKFHK